MFCKWKERSHASKGCGYFARGRKETEIGRGSIYYLSKEEKKLTYTLEVYIVQREEKGWGDFNRGQNEERTEHR